MLRAPRLNYYARWGCNERLRLSAIAAASMVPDLDYAGFLFDPYRFITEWHRGVTHSLVMLPLWAVLLGLFFSILTGRSTLRRELILLSALGLLLHILFDLITVYGTQIAAPWSDYRVALGLTFDADIWIASIAGISLLLSCYRRVFARYGIVLVGLYLGLALTTQLAAIRVGENRYGAPAHRIHAIAHPLSPFHRVVVVETDFGYWQSLLDLSGVGARLMAAAAANRIGLGAYRPQESLHWNWRTKPGTLSVDRETVQDAWRHEDMKRFRRFAVLPVVYRIDRAQFPICVWFTDLRYMIPGITRPFRYGMCRMDPDADWLGYRMKGFTESERGLIQ